MRKVILQMLVTLDGFYEGPNKEIDWHNVDKEFNKYAIGNLRKADTLVFGRVTYELMAAYWLTPTAMEDDPVVGEKMNNLRKIVFSKTLPKAGWNNTTLIKENAAEALAELKQQPGKNIAIFGSSDLALSFIRSDLIDEYQIFINPIVLGNGKPLFKGITERLDLKLIKIKRFKNGNVLLCYKPTDKDKSGGK
jgi:dihydrofolate reductase